MLRPGTSKVFKHFSVLGTLVGICYSSPIFVVFFIPIGVVYWFAQKVYIKTARQLKRMESAARSPIYSLFRWAQIGYWNMLT